MRTISASLMMQSILSSYRHSLFLQLLTMTILTGLQLPALVKGFPYELCNLGAVVGLFGYFLVAVAFLCKGKQVKTNWHKIVAVRPSKRKYGKSLLVFMFHMAIYPCEELHGFTAVAFDYRIILNQHFYPLRIFILAHLVYHKISISFLGNLMW